MKEDGMYPLEHSNDCQCSPSNITVNIGISKHRPHQTNWYSCTTNAPTRLLILLSFKSHFFTAIFSSILECDMISSESQESSKPLTVYNTYKTSI